MSKNRMFYGWVIAAGCSLVALINGGIFYSFSVFFKPVTADIHLSRNAESLNYAVMLLAYAPGSFFAGKLAMRFGPRRVLLAASILILVGFVICSIASILPLMILGYALVGVGLGSTFALPVATVMRWFETFRGLMVGLMSSANGVGGLIFAPLSQSLITLYGWRTSYLIIGIIFGVCVALGAAFLIAEPGKKGLQPYRSGQRDFRKPVSPQLAPAPGINLSRAYRNSTFWWVAVLYILVGMPMFFFMSHIVPLITDRGVSPEIAARGLGLIAAMGAVGPLAVSWLGGRAGWMKTLAVCLFIAAGSVVWLMFVTGEGGYYLFVVIYGLAIGGLIALLGGAVGSFFGLTHVSELLGFLLGISVVFSAILPWLGGFIFDLTQSYFIAAITTIAILVAAGVIALLLRPPRPQPAYAGVDGVRVP